MSDNEQNSDYSNSDSENETQRKTNLKFKGNDKSIKALVSPNIDDDYDSDSDISVEEVEDIEEDQTGGAFHGIESGSDQEDENEDEDEDTETEAEEESENDDDEGEKQQKITSKKTKGNKAKKPVQINLHNDDDDDDDDDDDLYLQKFDNEITKNYINEFHPECLIHNYDEIAKLTIVVRDSNNIIIDPLHKTIPFLTKYERARILGQRAKQIETGARPFVNVPENVIDSYVIAELELQQKRIPFIIRRPIPGGACE